MPLVGRRTALAGALGGIATTLLAAGCDTGDDLEPPGEAGSPSPSVTGTRAPEQTPDEVLVDDVTARLASALAVALHAAKAPGLRPVITPLVRAHRAHLRALDEEPSSESAPGPPPRAGLALRQVRQGEGALQAFLVEASGRAESGALAKLLASMSASVTQHLAALPGQA